MPSGLEQSDRAGPLRPRCRRLMGVRVLGTGSYVPDAVVTNLETPLRAASASDSDWIVKRTGIAMSRPPRTCQTRRPATCACNWPSTAVLNGPPVDPRDIDLLLVGTFTPDYSPFPRPLASSRTGSAARLLHWPWTCKRHALGSCTRLLPEPLTSPAGPCPRTLCLVVRRGATVTRASSIPTISRRIHSSATGPEHS